LLAAAAAAAAVVAHTQQWFDMKAVSYKYALLLRSVAQIVHINASNQNSYSFVTQHYS
jgi:hypothetical protein